MPHPDEAALVASLPGPARDALQQALDAAPPTLAAGWNNRGKDHQTAWSRGNQALELVGFVLDAPLPLARDLTPEQRAVATVFAHREEFHRYLRLLPSHAYWKRRWLGLEPPGAIEREIDGRDGEPARLPLWRALALRRDREALLSLDLPLLDRLEITWDVLCDAYRLGVGMGFDTLRWGQLDEIQGQPEIAALATRCLDQMATARGRGEPCVVFADQHSLSWPFFHAIHTADVPFKPAWDFLLPAAHSLSASAKGKRWGDFATFCAYLDRLPPERRLAGLVSSQGHLRGDVASSLGLLPRYPSRELTQAILDAIPESRLPEPQVLKSLTATAATHPVVAAVLASFKETRAAAKNPAPKPAAKRR